MEASYTNMPLIYQKYDNGMARSATQYFCMGISYKHPSGRTEQKNSKVQIIEDYFLTQNRIEGSKVYINTDLINSRYFYNEYFKVTNTLTNTSLTYYKDSSDQHQYLAEESALVSNQGVLSSTGGKVSFNITTEI